jgi:trk system potassium uptake protein TrkA
VKIVIVGAGEVGFHIASRLALENKDVVVIDSNPEALKRLSESIDVQTIIGSGSSPAVLEAASIREAEIMLAVTDSDEVNLVACLMADTLSPTTKKLARLRGADFDRYHDIQGERAAYRYGDQPRCRSGPDHRTAHECSGRRGRGRIRRRPH